VSEGFLSKLITLSQALKIFGSNKPALLQDLEYCLWSAIIDIAQGKSQTIPRMNKAITSMEERINNDPDVPGTSSWFSG
jgi:hypothetical protein